MILSNLKVYQNTLLITSIIVVGLVNETSATITSEDRLLLQNCSYSSFNNGTTCVPCSNNCSTCSDNAYNCTSCYSGYFIQNLTNGSRNCYPCMPNCRNCTVKDVCIQCEEYYSLDSQSKSCKTSTASLILILIIILVPLGAILLIVCVILGICAAKIGVCCWFLNKKKTSSTRATAPVGLTGGVVYGPAGQPNNVTARLDPETGRMIPNNTTTQPVSANYAQYGPPQTNYYPSRGNDNQSQPFLIANQLAPQPYTTQVNPTYSMQAGPPASFEGQQPVIRAIATNQPLPPGF